MGIPASHWNNKPFTGTWQTRARNSPKPSSIQGFAFSANFPALTPRPFQIVGDGDPGKRDRNPDRIPLGGIRKLKMRYGKFIALDSITTAPIRNAGRAADDGPTAFRNDGSDR